MPIFRKDVVREAVEQLNTRFDAIATLLEDTLLEDTPPTSDTACQHSGASAEDFGKNRMGIDIEAIVRIAEHLKADLDDV